MKNTTLLLLLCTTQITQSAELQGTLNALHNSSPSQSIIECKKPKLPNQTGWSIFEGLAAIKQFLNPKSSPKTVFCVCPFETEGENTQCMSPSFHHTQETYLTCAARSGDCNPFIAIFDTPCSTFSQNQNAEIMHALFILATNRQQAEENNQRARELHFSYMFSDVAERFLPHMLEDASVSSRDFEYALVSMLPLVTKRQQDFLEHVIEIKNQMENPKAPQYLDDEFTTTLSTSLKE